jgi:ribonucleoside-triphosphate reductase
MNEMVLNFSEGKQNITETSGIHFATEILDHIRLRMKEFQEETGNLYNLEATPAEGTTYRFAKEDKKRFPEILQAGQNENIYYTNSSQIPVDYTDDPFEALLLQDELQCKYTGGTVLHLYMREKISSPEACKNFVKKVLTSFKLPYITVTPIFSICPIHGYLNGEHEYCPKCDEILLNKKKQMFGLYTCNGISQTCRKF